MGQAKARGSKDQRVAEAVERARVAEIARREQARADRMARAAVLEAKQAERDKENAERLARGDKPLSERVQLGRGRSQSQSLSTLLAVAGIAMLASR